MVPQSKIDVGYDWTGFTLFLPKDADPAVSKEEVDALFSLTRPAVPSTRRIDYPHMPMDPAPNLSHREKLVASQLGFNSLTDKLWIIEEQDFLELRKICSLPDDALGNDKIFDAPLSSGVA